MSLENRSVEMKNVFDTFPVNFLDMSPSPLTPSFTNQLSNKSKNNHYTDIVSPSMIACKLAPPLYSAKLINTVKFGAKYYYSIQVVPSITSISRGCPITRPPYYILRNFQDFIAFSQLLSSYPEYINVPTLHQDDDIHTMGPPLTPPTSPGIFQTSTGFYDSDRLSTVRSRRAMFVTTKKDLQSRLDELEKFMSRLFHLPDSVSCRLVREFFGLWKRDVEHNISQNAQDPFALQAQYGGFIRSISTIRNIQSSDSLSTGYTDESRSTCSSFEHDKNSKVLFRQKSLNALGRERENDFSKAISSIPLSLEPLKLTLPRHPYPSPISSSSSTHQSNFVGDEYEDEAFNDILLPSCPPPPPPSIFNRRSGPGSPTITGFPTIRAKFITQPEVFDLSNLSDALKELRKERSYPPRNSSLPTPPSNTSPVTPDESQSSISFNSSSSRGSSSSVFFQFPLPHPSTTSSILHPNPSFRLSRSRSSSDLSASDNYDVKVKSQMEFNRKSYRGGSGGSGSSDSTYGSLLPVNNSNHIVKAKVVIDQETAVFVGDINPEVVDYESLCQRVIEKVESTFGRRIGPAKSWILGWKTAEGVTLLRDQFKDGKLDSALQKEWLRRSRITFVIEPL